MQKRSKNQFGKIFLVFLVLLIIPRAAGCRVVVLGDSHGDVREDLLTLIDAQDPDIVLHTGDAGSCDNLGDYTVFYSKGNHDSTEYGNYAWTVDNTRFVVLDSNDIDNATDYLYNESVSQNFLSAEYRILVFHHAAYCEHWHEPDYNGEVGVRSLVPVITENHFDLVLNGHAHAYERGLINSTYYITTGGAGGELDTLSYDYDHITVSRDKYNFVVLTIDENNMEVRAFDDHNNTLDWFNVSSTDHVTAAGHIEVQDLGAWTFIRENWVMALVFLIEITIIIFYFTRLSKQSKGS